MKFNTTTYILNLPHPHLKQACLQGPYPMWWYVVKYKNNNKIAQTKQNKTRQKTKRVFPQKDIFCERTIIKCKASGKKWGGKKRRKRACSSVGGSFSCELAANQLLNYMPKIRWWIIGNEIFVPGKPTAKILLISMGQGCLSGLNSQSCRIGNSIWTSLFVISPWKSVLVCFICTCDQHTGTIFFWHGGANKQSGFNFSAQDAWMRALLFLPSISESIFPLKGMGSLTANGSAVFTSRGELSL